MFKLLTPMRISQSVVVFYQRSFAHTHAFSRSLQFISNEKISNFNGLQVMDKEITDRPLTLLYSWMLGRDSHISKYANIYINQGINVLKVKISPFDLLRPTKGSQRVASEVLNFLHLNPSLSPLFVHGFSVGAYTFNESMVQVAKDMPKHEPLLKRFVGQIWDSAVDIQGIPAGLPRAITDNKVFQNSMEKYLRWYMKFNYQAATQHYENSSNAMHANTLNAPGLFIFSKTDPVSTPEMNMAVINAWERKGITVFTKCFESSPHVSHFLKYKREYEYEVNAFLEKVGMLQQAKGRAVSV